MPCIYLFFFYSIFLYKTHFSSDLTYFVDETENTQSSQKNTHQHIYNDDTVHNERATQDIQDDNQDEVSQNSQSRQNEDNNTDLKFSH
jgi:hypothetical protein